MLLPHLSINADLLAQPIVHIALTSCLSTHATSFGSWYRSPSANVTVGSDSQITMKEVKKNLRELQTMGPSAGCIAGARNNTPQV